MARGGATGSDVWVAVSPEVEIGAIAAGGDGVGRLADGRAVFVPRTAPGDRALLRDVVLSKRFARARLAGLVAAGPGRVDPPCPHYVDDDCGGCQLQHLSAAAQLAAKSRIVGDALRRIGKIAAPDPSVQPAPDAWRYRSRIALHREGERIGFHRITPSAPVFDLAQCHIATDAVMALWADLSRHRELLPPAVRRLTLREGREGNRAVVLDVTGDLRAVDLTALRDALPSVDFWLTGDSGTAVPPTGRHSAPPAFEQVYPEMGRELLAAALRLLAAEAGEVVWDLYAGRGAAAAALARRACRVAAVESDPGAMAAARGRATEGLSIRWVEGRVEDVLGLLDAPNRILLNPPRGGLAESVSEALAKSGARRLVYVSCDPATLARDLARLNEHYALATVEAFDLFPQTAHVETIAVLEGR